MKTKFLVNAILINGHARPKWVSANASAWSWLTNRSECPEVKRRTELTPKETESGSCRVIVPACLEEPEESTLHQLQLRPEGLMGRTTQQGSRVRRPISARANWSLRPGLTPSSLRRDTYTCMELLWEGVFHQNAPDQGGLCCAPGPSGDQSDFHSNNQSPSTYIANSATYGDSWAGLEKSVDRSRHLNTAY